MDFDFDFEFQPEQTVDLMDDNATDKMLNEVWDTYDVDKTGQLNKDKTKSLCQEFMVVNEEGEDITNENFDKIFSNIDKNNDGKVEKNDLFDYIKAFLKK